MDEQIRSLFAAFDSIKKTTPSGADYWMGRDLQVVLDYARWESFEEVIKKAETACGSSGIEVDNQFRRTTKMVFIGSGGQRKIDDYFLSRFACYLIAMNGEATKQTIAVAQSYFAIQTRRQELADQANLLEGRVEMRIKVTEATKALNKTAQEAGVQDFALFHDAGYRGLYEMGLADIKQRKSIGPKEQLYDRAGRAELMANGFRLTQTEEKIAKEQIKGQQNAISIHRQIGKKVRDAIKDIGGTMPEDLPAEPSLKKLSSKKIATLPKQEADK